MTPDPAEMLLRLHDAEADNHLAPSDSEAPSSGLRSDLARILLFDPPVVAVANASDPWFAKMKEVIGPWHWTPAEVLSIISPGATAHSVIAWCLPISEPIRRSNRDETEFPSRPWAMARTKADGILMRMSEGLERMLRDLGFAAVAPVRLARQPDDPRPPGSLSARWSLRHVAFVAGLGTFGISGGLITERGIAHRLGSVVTDAPIPATPRAYGDDPFAWCLRSARGTCGACIQRCPVGSIGESVHARNIPACYNYRERIRALARGRYDWESAHYGCGLCQAGVPCESRNPTGEVRSSKLETRK